MTCVGSNPMPTFKMTPKERRAELCKILAAGLIRLKKVKTA